MKHKSKATSFSKPQTPLRRKATRLFSHGSLPHAVYLTSTSLFPRHPWQQEVRVSQSPPSAGFQRKQALICGGPHYPLSDTSVQRLPQVSAQNLYLHPCMTGVLTAPPIKAFGAFMQMAHTPEPLSGVREPNLFLQKC